MEARRMSLVPPKTLRDYSYSFLAARRAILLPDKRYFFYLLDRIRQARFAIHAAVFIVDVHPSHGGTGARRILSELSYANWLGLDVRVIVGRSAKTRAIDVVDHLSFRTLRDAGVPVRIAKPVGRRSSLHSKYVIIDGEEVILGSHNWAFFDLFNSRQTSIAIESNDLAKRMQRRFEELWDNSYEEFP
jgi:phosphatidylserine/phosphatidylglycerophosphate/cardiolipin synthase-like enzyme